MAQHREPGLADQLPWPFGQSDTDPNKVKFDALMEALTPDPETIEAVVEKFGGEDYNPEGSGWFKPWASCPECGETLIGWTDKKLIELIYNHCERTGHALPEL